MLAGLVTFAAFGPKLDPDRWAVTLRFAGAGIWAGPLVIMMSQGPVWSALAASVMGAALGRVLGQFDRAIAKPEFNLYAMYSSPGMFGELSLAPTWPGRPEAFLAAILLQLGVAATLGNRNFMAAFCCGFACCLVTWATRTTPAQTAFRLTRSTAVQMALSLFLAILITGVVSTAFYERSGDGGRERSQGGSGSDKDRHSGVVLLSELKSHTVLIAPQPNRPQVSFRLQSAPPASIPFTGEYWFLPWPLHKPPKSALIHTGSPLLEMFSNLPTQRLVMTARQSLDKPIPLTCCNRIDMEVTSTDKQQDTVSIELVLVNSQLEKKPLSQSLGELRLTSRRVPMAGGSAAAMPERLRYSVPEESAISEFDQIRVIYHLDVPREHRSANVAIERFFLVPRSL
jgi:hypothetical protein